MNTPHNSIVALLLLCAGVSTTAFAAGEFDIPWYSQHALSAFGASESGVEATLSNALRIKPQYESKRISIEAALIAHAEYRTLEAPLTSAMTPFRLVDVSSVHVYENHVVWSYDVDRLWFEVSQDDTYLTIGRQSRDWGLGRVVRPNDMFSRLSPIALQQEERLGADMASVTHYIDNSTDVQINVLPFAHNDLTYSMVAARVRTRLSITDIALYAHAMEHMLGFGCDIETSILDAGVRFEMTFLPQSVESTESQYGVSFGVDNQFENVYVALELATGTEPIQQFSTMLFGLPSTRKALHVVSLTSSLQLPDDYSSVSLFALGTSQSNTVVQCGFSNEYYESLSLVAALAYASIDLFGQRSETFGCTLSARWFH